MIKDNRKRQTLKQYGKERLRVNSLRKNDILPIELRVSIICSPYCCGTSCMFYGRSRGSLVFGPEKKDSVACR